MAGGPLIYYFLDNRQEDGRTRTLEEYVRTVVKHDSPESGCGEANVAGSALAKNAYESIDSFIGEDNV